jgi:hypothetical protein
MYFMAIWNIIWRFGIFYDHLVQFVCIHSAWYIFSDFGIMYQEKSGDPEQQPDDGIRVTRCVCEKIAHNVHT